MQHMNHDFVLLFAVGGQWLGYFNPGNGNDSGCVGSGNYIAGHFMPWCFSFSTHQQQGFFDGTGTTIT